MTRNSCHLMDVGACKQSGQGESGLILLELRRPDVDRPGKAGLYSRLPLRIYRMGIGRPVFNAVSNSYLTIEM